MMNAQAIKDDWVNQRCSPAVIPFVGFINKPDNKSVAEFTEENFNYCIQNILINISGVAVQPFTYLINFLTRYPLHIFWISVASCLFGHTSDQILFFLTFKCLPQNMNPLSTFDVHCSLLFLFLHDAQSMYYTLASFFTKTDLHVT